MTRFGSLVLCVTLGSALLACGSNSNNSPKDPIELVPLDNQVSGWTVDQDHNLDPGQRAMVGHDPNGVSDLIDGAKDRFYTTDGVYKPTEFLWQNYKNSSLASAPDGATVKLYILQMSSVDQASGLYGRTLQDQDHVAFTWQDPTTPLVGTDSRLADTGSQWYFNFRQGVYYVEFWLTPSAGPASTNFAPGNAETKQEAFSFAQAIVKGM